MKIERKKKPQQLTLGHLAAGDVFTLWEDPDIYMLIAYGSRERKVVNLRNGETTDYSADQRVLSVRGKFVEED